MNTKAILFPLLAMFALTCVVAVVMFRRRVSFYKANRVHPQKTATSAQMTATMPDSRAPDNFRNLFETPVLFYIAVVVLYVTALSSPVALALAWAYVLARCVHSFIHCGSNTVMRRFYAFASSCVLLLLLWLLLAYQLLTSA